MVMKVPPHPDEVIREFCVEPGGLTVTAAAAVLGVSRKALSELLNGHSGISPEMAVRLSKAFGGSTESWLTQQMRYDLAQVENRAAEINVRRYEPA
jgi:addiction module HigA family antidote